MAFIITENCTGCTACIRRCPTEAITGERKLLHVIDPELCIDCHDNRQTYSDWVYSFEFSR